MGAIVKKILVIAAASMCTAYAGIVSAQQTQEATPAQQAPDTSGAPATSGASGTAPVAGRVPVGVTKIEMDEIIVGWSAKKEILGKRVMNDAKERIGEVEDLIITPQKAASYAIIGVGGFLGLGQRRVAIPIQQLKLQGTDFVLAGATKEALRDLPQFEYARK